MKSVTQGDSSAPIYEGKAKRLFRQADGLIRHEFKNSATAFNGQKKAEFEGKGLLNSKMSAKLFSLLEKEGILTHFVRWEEPQSLITRELKMLPIELVVRNKVAGSLAKRLGISEGQSIEPPLVEWFLKDDAKGDPQVSEGILISLYHQKREVLKEMKTLSLKINALLREVYHEADLELVDFKLEFGIDSMMRICLGDEISPDTSRLWDVKTGEKLDKDRFRFELGDLMQGYREIFQRLEKVLEKKT